MFLTKEAVRLGLPGYAEASPATAARRSRACSSSSRDGGGELLVCPICFDARKLDDERARAQRPPRRRHPAVGVDRRRAGDGVQLLATADAELHAGRTGGRRERELVAAGAQPQAGDAAGDPPARRAAADGGGGLLACGPGGAA